MKRIFLFIILQSYLCAYTQTINPKVINSCSINYSNIQMYIDISIGESLINFEKCPTSQITQGFLQPHVSGITWLGSTLQGSVIHVYPNPAADYLSVIFENTCIRYAGIINEQGQTIFLPINNYRINIRELAPGAYRLKFVNQSKQNIQYVKFIKL